MTSPRDLLRGDRAMRVKAGRYIGLATVAVLVSGATCPLFDDEGDTIILGPQQSIAASPDRLEMQVGESRSVVITLVGVSDSRVSATSQNASIATASGDRDPLAVTCTGPGQTTIEVRSVAVANLRTSVIVVCTPPPLALSVAPAELTLLIGTTGTLTCTVTRIIDAAVLPNEPVTWTSADPAVALVAGTGPSGQTGVVTAVSVGETQATCAAPDRSPAPQASATVRVAPLPTPMCGGSGLRVFAVTVNSDPFGHVPFIGMPPTLPLNVMVMNGQVAVTGPPPFVPVSGSIDADCAIAATGTGTVAGIPGVGVRLTGPLPAQGSFDWLYEVGVPGGLPGGPTVYRFTLQ
jgi:hypothetical protein